MHRSLRTTRDFTNLQGRPGWYRITNQAAGPAQVTIYDEIGFLGVSADSFMHDLAGVDGDIEMHINSPGGDVFDGIAIYNQLRQRAGGVSVIVDGLAASAASFIAQAASPGQLAMAPHSQMMIHDGFGMTIGNADDMRKTAELLEKASDNIAGIYADRTGKPADYWRGLMRNETWLSDAEAVAEGLADRVLGQDPPAGGWDLSVYHNAAGKPKKPRKQRAEAPEPSPDSLSETEIFAMFARELDQLDAGKEQ
jgi:ATP-dependent Clp endopeptidase proteolytic subunit ClpP